MKTYISGWKGGEVQIFSKLFDQTTNRMRSQHIPTKGKNPKLVKDAVGQAIRDVHQSRYDAKAGLDELGSAE